MFDLFDNTADSQIEDLLRQIASSDENAKVEEWQIPYLLQEPFVSHVQTPSALQTVDPWKLQSSYTRILGIAFELQNRDWQRVLIHIGSKDPLNILRAAREQTAELLYWFLSDVFVEFPSEYIEDCREILLDVSSINSADGVDIVALEAVRIFELLSPAEFNLHIGLKVRQLEIHQNAQDVEPVQYSISGRASDEEHASRLAGARALAIAEYINELQAHLWQE